MPSGNIIACGLLLATLACCGCQPTTQARTKYTVTGRVLVNGKPAEGVQVRLLPAAGSPDGAGGSLPVGLTDEQGRFELSSLAENDGAVAGTYKAVFFWPTNVLRPDQDRLRERFTDPGKSQFEVVVQDEATQLSPFDVEFPESELLPMELSASDLKTMTPDEIAKHQPQ